MNAAQLILPALCAAALSLGAAMPRITVDAAKPVGPVNPLAFGANIEAADDRGIFDRPFSAPINPHGVAQGEGTWDPAANRPHPGIVRKLREMRIGATPAAASLTTTTGSRRSARCPNAKTGNSASTNTSGSAGS